MKTLLLLGGDTVQREKIIAKIAKEAYPGLDVERKTFKADQGQIPKAIEELFSYSLFDEAKMVILTGLDKLFARKNKSEDEDEEEESVSGAKAIEPLYEVIAHPRGDSPFLMIAETKTGIPKKFLDALGKERIVTVSTTSLADIRRSVEKKSALAGFTFSKDALAFFMETCGHSVESAKQEFEKIQMWVDPGEEISLEMCRRLIWGEKEQNIFEISNGVRDHNPTKALRALNKMFAQGEEGYSIMGTLIRAFRDIHTFKSLQEENIPRNEWQSYAKINPKAIQFKIQDASQFKYESIRKAVSLICRADSDIKGGKSNPKLVIERLVLDLCRI